MISPPPSPASAPCLALDRIRRASFLFPKPLQPLGQFAPALLYVADKVCTSAERHILRTPSSQQLFPDVG
jgi:hypothetical protein